MFKKILPFIFLLAVSCSKKEDPIIKSSAKTISSFSFNNYTPSIVANIDENTKNISANFPIGTDLTKLIPTITISPLATISPSTGILQDFTNPVIYTVKAEDGSSTTYTVKITRTKSISKSLKSFVFNGLSPLVSATLDSVKHTITALLPTGTDLTKLTPTIDISPLANVSPATGVVQDFSKPVTYTISAEDGSKQSWIATITSLDVVVLIPDAKFERALIRLGIDDIEDGKLSKSKAEKITSLDVQWWENYESLTNLQGIEAFTNLKNLNCSSNELSNLNLSKNLLLEDLNCSKNKLTNLDVSKNIYLKSLKCGGFFNKISSLDLSKNIALVYLDCFGQALTSLDVTKNIALQYLDCSAQQLSGYYLTGLDISKNIALKELYCSSQNITSLDFSKCPNLLKVDCFRNKVKSLDFSNNPLLQVLDCSEIYTFSTLDLLKNTALTKLNCSSNNLTDLNVSKIVALSSLDCSYNKIKTICVSSLNQPSPNNWVKDATATYSLCK